MKNLKYGQSGQAAPPVTLGSTAPGRLRVLPSYEDHAQRAAVDPITHIVNLVEDRNWFTPGAVMVAAIGVAFPWTLVIAIVTTLVIGVLHPAKDWSWILGVASLGYFVGWFWLTMRWLNWHKVGTGADARRKAHLVRNSFLLIGLTVNLPGTLLFMLIWRLFQGRRRGYNDKMYQKERDVRIP